MEKCWDYINTINPMNLADIYITLHSNTKEFNNFSTVHGTFFRTDHILGHNTSLNRYKKLKYLASYLTIVN